MKTKTIVYIILAFIVIIWLFWPDTSYADENRIDLSGDGSETGTQPKQREITYYIDSLPFGVDNIYTNSVREGISYWETRENVIFKESLSQNVDVRVMWVKEFGGEHLGYAYNKEFIEIGLGDSLCDEKWQPYQYESVLTIATHEFGHVVGKSHSSNPQDIMYTPISTKYETDIKETEIIPDGEGRYYPVCTREEVAEYLVEVISDVPLNVYIVPSLEELNKLEDEETFTHYVNCFEEETTHYKKSCTIDSSSLIVLRNPTIFALGDNARFEITIKEK